MQHKTRQQRGCNKGQNCKFFHPVMYLNSLRKNECYNENCHFKHVKGTVRTQTKTSDNEKPPRNSTKFQDTNTPNQHFIQLIQTLRSEMDTKINTISMQIQQMITFQNAQNLHQTPQNNVPQHRHLNLNQAHQPMNQIKSF